MLGEIICAGLCGSVSDAPSFNVVNQEKKQGN